MKPTWTQEMIDELRRCYTTMPTPVLALRIGKTPSAVKTKANKLGITKENRRYLSASEKEYIDNHYATELTKDIAKQLNCGVFAINNYAYRAGLKKDDKFKKEQAAINVLQAGVNSRFSKGHIPANKGKTMPVELYEKSKHTFFKKGHMPHNSLEVGAEVVRKNKGYNTVMVKVAGERKLKAKHRYIWEYHNGKIPKGHNIQFKDGNSLNCEIDNLYMIARSEQIKNNTIQRYPAEIKTAIRHISKINKLINE